MYLTLGIVHFIFVLFRACAASLAHSMRFIVLAGQRMLLVMVMP